MKEKTSTIGFTLDVQYGIKTLQGMSKGYMIENEAYVDDPMSLDGKLTQTIFQNKDTGERYQVTVIKLDDGSVFE